MARRDGHLGAILDACGRVGRKHAVFEEAAQGRRRRVRGTPPLGGRSAGGGGVVALAFQSIGVGAVCLDGVVVVFDTPLFLLLIESARIGRRRETNQLLHVLPPRLGVVVAAQVRLEVELGDEQLEQITHRRLLVCGGTQAAERAHQRLQGLHHRCTHTRAERRITIDELLYARMQRQAVLCRKRLEVLHRLGADPAARHVDDAQERRRVRRVVDEQQIRQEVLNLGAVKELGAADHAVGNALALQRGLERTAERVEAQQDAHVRVREHGPREVDVALDLERNVLRLFVRGGERVKGDGRAAALGGVQVLVDTLRVLAHDLDGRVEDRLCAAEVFLEKHAADVGEVGAHLREVADLGVAPAVDALVGVAHDADVPRRGRQQAHQLVLHRIRVLELVDEHCGQ